VNPPDSAGAVKVTVPVNVAPPVRDAGVNAREARPSATGLTVSTAVFVTPAAEAVSVTVVVPPTKPAETTNLATEEPPTTITYVGTVAAALSLVRLTAKPLVVAMPVRVTVPVADIPPFTAAGLSEMPAMVGGLTISGAVCVTPE
jgi:hypothetical protein